jgi:hypothetical protein
MMTLGFMEFELPAASHFSFKDAGRACADACINAK